MTVSERLLKPPGGDELCHCSGNEATFSGSDDNSRKKILLESLENYDVKIGLVAQRRLENISLSVLSL